MAYIGPCYPVNLVPIGAIYAAVLLCGWRIFALFQCFSGISNRSPADCGKCHISIIANSSRFADKRQHVGPNGTICNNIEPGVMLQDRDSASEKSLIEVVRYNPKWLEMFRSERVKLQSIEVYSEIHVEHIGSTAVKAMAAKPIVDVMLGIDGYRGGAELDQPLANLGYRSAPEPQQHLPHTRFFIRRDHQHRRTHHLHLVEYKTEFWCSRLMFRDYLRQHFAISRLYGELKKMGAEQYPNDRDAYNAFKSSFIHACLKTSSNLE